MNRKSPLEWHATLREQINDHRNNACCGHTFTVMNEIFETISPSRCRDETIKIPLSPYIGRFLPNQEAALKRKSRNSKNKTNENQLALQI